MKKQTLLSAAIAAAVVGSFALIAVNTTLAQTDPNYNAPRTEWGTPDLRGVFNFSSNTPLERPREYGDRQYYTPEEVMAAPHRAELVDTTSSG